MYPKVVYRTVEDYRVVKDSDSEAAAKTLGYGDYPTFDKEDLSKRYEDLTGKKPDGRWSRERLEDEIANVN